MMTVRAAVNGAAWLRRLHNQAPPYEVKMLSRAETGRLLPAIGPDVAGASFCPLDGHADALRLFRALPALYPDRFPVDAMQPLLRHPATLEQVRAGKWPPA